MEDKSDLQNIVRGGQTLDHVIGMAKQVAYKVVTVGGFVFILSFIVATYLQKNPIYLRESTNYLMAWYVADYNQYPQKTIPYIKPPFKLIWVPAGNVYNDFYLRHKADETAKVLGRSMSYSGALFLVVVVAIFFFIRRYGDKVKSDKHLRGSKTGTNSEVKYAIEKLVKSDKYLSFGDLELAGIRLPFQWEPQHFSLMGGSGTGKSVIYGYFIDSIRKQNRRAIIHDRSGTYIEKFYNPETDIILNPFDSRTAQWSLFGECSKPYHFDQVSEVLFPETKGDPFWYLAPRMVFTALAKQESISDNPTTRSLVNRVMRCTLEQMIDICRGTDAMTVLDKNGLKVAQTIRSIIATNIRQFSIFDGNKDSTFSIRDWIKDDSKSGFVFISSDREKEVVLKPIITLWVDLAVSATLSMTEKLDRRIWFLLDELQALGQLVSLHAALAESRKYGGCFVNGFQGYSQACKIYTKEGVGGLMDCISTFIFTRCNASETAEWAEKQLGKSEQIESNQTLSYGMRDVRDSQGQNQTKQNRNAVLASELQNLPDLHAYIRFGRGVPVTKVEFEYKSRPKVHPGIIENNQISDVEDIVDDAEELTVNDQSGESSMDSVAQEKSEADKQLDMYRQMEFTQFPIESQDEFSNLPSESLDNDNVSYDDEFDLFGDGR